MKTPICDFVRAYAAEGDLLRLHMPGHKGRGALGIEHLDITEIEGADALYLASGIIAESEQNASRLFGAHTVYSTEGSSHCIRAMLLLALQCAHSDEKPLILAGRNAHSALMSAAALLDFDIEWLPCEENGSYLSCAPSREALQARLQRERKPLALYLTSPDYLGRTADITALADVCRAHGVLLLVDNAHGAYLRFLAPSRHPIDLGATMCCDSAHKTLPVLTGGAFLHIAHNAPAPCREGAKHALSLFGTSSPSYLILQSIDAALPYLETGFKDELATAVHALDGVKARLEAHGIALCGDEPMKLTLMPKSFGYRGTEIAAYLRKSGIVCEFADPDFTVLMPSPSLSSDALSRIERALLALPPRAAIEETPPCVQVGEAVLSVREAMLAPSLTVPAAESEGCVLAAAALACPPAVPLAIAGERITRQTLACFAYYGKHTVRIVQRNDLLPPKLRDI